MKNCEIKESAYASGADLCGIASIDRFADAPSGFHPADIFKDTKSVAVFARRIPGGTTAALSRLPYSISDDIATDQIRNITYNFSLLLEDKGITAVPVYTEPYSYWDKDSMTGKGDLSLKHAGFLAGLGVIGKNNLLYNYKYGNMIKLGALLMNIEVEPDEIQSFSFCRDTCLLCVKNCPSGAITPESVIQKNCRSFSEGLTLKGHSLTTCNLCRTICPYSCGIGEQ